MPATTPRPPSSEQVAAFDRTAWSRSIGIHGRYPRNPHSRRETMRSRLIINGSLLILGCGTNVKDLRIGLDMFGLLTVGCGYSQNPIYSRRSFSRAELHNVSLKKANLKSA